MRRKEVLEKRRQRLTSKISELEKRAEACEDVKELRSISSRIDEIKEDIEDIDEEIRSLAELDDKEPAPVATRGLKVVSSTSQDIDDDPTNSKEYRKAFMNFVLRKEPIPAELRQNAVTKTTDFTSGTIPTVLVDRIVEAIDNVGMILPLVNRSSIAAGVVIPTSTVKPVASWVSEGASSDRQKKTIGKISFTAFKLRCEISMTMEVKTMALAAFERVFVKNVSKAMVKIIETAIISGTGETSPKGILAETPVTGQALEIAEASTIDYATLCDIEAAIPEEYEATAKLAMTKKTFMKILAMTDDNGQPIARVNYGIGGKPERTVLGREVVINPYMDSYADSVSSDTICIFAFNFDDYTFNTVYDIASDIKQDWDTEDWCYKSVMSCDGKVVDKSSLVTVTKKAPAVVDNES